MTLRESIRVSLFNNTIGYKVEVVDEIMYLIEVEMMKIRHNLFRKYEIVIPEGEDNNPFQKGYGYGVVESQRELLKNKDE